MGNNRRNFIKSTTLAGIGLGLAGNISLYANSKSTSKGRIGIIGLDTSHVTAFTKSINDAERAEFKGFSVVAAYPTKGSADMPASIDRLDKFTEEIRAMGVEIVTSIEELLTKVDFILLESVDGRRHLEEALPVLKSGKRMFVDKPLSNSLEGAVALFEASKKYNAPMFSASSTRFAPESVAIIKGNEAIGEVLGAHTYGPAGKQLGHLDMAYYGIHGIEALFTLMGTGCKEVTRFDTPSSTVVTGVWSDGRIGVFTATPEGGKASFGGVVHGSKGVAEKVKILDGYDPLIVEIINFFKTGVVPVSRTETLEIFAFMAAADESKLRRGKPVVLEEMMRKAEMQLQKR
ncbi:Inositol 2-dehydrogenase/D-chiro-inositol 3-dehydrogenase [Arenibacter antarcticus]|uniref:Gfo/Idh/MocA family protein n=1 Tax=Arenibacter antarcticus TaxID=2040469 RepID=A0ABW5VJC3_9FLAO|nr:Gfo/Idh/MocA family oxidoreductase [Arenibacter sp. H213]MCM4169078.1 dehydrogenase [Arenibacter sp. H213]